MPMSNAAASGSDRLQRLVGFLDQDPENHSLLVDTISLALNEGQIDIARKLLSNGKVISESSPVLLNLHGLVAMAQRHFDEAGPIFEYLIATGADTPAVRFNLAWVKAMIGDFAATHELLDNQAMEASPHGPSLKIQAMHHLELYEDALAIGDRLAESYPSDTALMGALATLAMDAEDVERARHFAERSGDSAEGLAVRGMLMLDRQKNEDALALFDSAIDRQPANPRAWIGRGLGLLSAGESAAAAEALEHGAGLFEDHQGSWIGAAWAHFMNEDYAKARANFERARVLDPNFSEVHGGLAVLDIIDGNMESAERHCEVALRLDRNSFGGALAKVLLLDRQGKRNAAQRIRDIALSTPIGPDGRTIAQALRALSGARS